MTTGAGSDSAGPPLERRRTWEHPVDSHWLLVGGIGVEDDDLDDLPLALCAQIEGLFVDLPPRRDRFTLVGCTPDGALADLLDRLPAAAPGRAWLDDLSLTAPGPQPGRPPHRWSVDLGDLVVRAQRPGTVPGTVDIDLDGFVRFYERTDAVVRPCDVTEFVLLSRDGAPYGTCRDVVGVFRERSAPPVPQVRLLGCRPEPALLRELGAVGPPSGAGVRHRRLWAVARLITADGPATGVFSAVVSGTITATEPSQVGPDLLDVTVDSDPREPLPTGILRVLEHWRTGRPTRKNLWAGYDPETRHHWSAVAVGRRRDAPDRPAGTTYDLDGRFVTDVDGFYCAIGEAINGPGGYFGRNLDALDDCLYGGFGARTPFRLVWHDSAVARDHLVARDPLVTGDDQRVVGPPATFEQVLGILTRHDVAIDLR